MYNMTDELHLLDSYWMYNTMGKNFFAQYRSQYLYIAFTIVNKKNIKMLIQYMNNIVPNNSLSCYHEALYITYFYNIIL